MKFIGLCVGLFLSVSFVFGEGLEIGEMRLQWSVVSNDVIFTLEAPTAGWISVGWGATRQMKDADIIIGFVTNGNVGVIEDHFGVSPVRHMLDTDLGGRDNVRLLEASEQRGVTRLVFSRPLETRDANDVALVLGQPIDIIVAYGRFDNTRSKHTFVGRGRIILRRTP